MPKVSVLMPVYNGEQYLRESIDSILNQTYQDFEFLIIDDGSTDDTKKIVLSYKDSRIQFIENGKNIGLIKSLNKGIALAKGDLIARQDADDISIPERLEKQIKVFEDDLEVSLVSCNLQFIDSNNRGLRILERACWPGLVPWYLIFYNHISGHSQVVFRRDISLNLGMYSEYQLYTEDYDLWIRFAEIGCKIVILPEVLVQYRQHSESVSCQKKEQQELYSLSRSRDYLNQFLSLEFTLEEIKLIREFWLGHLDYYDFPSALKAKYISTIFRDLVQVFASKKSDSENCREDLVSALEKEISNQFIRWIQSPLSSHHGLLSKAIVSCYAFSWSGAGIFNGWFIWLKRFPANTFDRIKRKINTHFQFKYSPFFERN